MSETAGIAPSAKTVEINSHSVNFGPQHPDSIPAGSVDLVLVARRSGDEQDADRLPELLGCRSLLAKGLHDANNRALRRRAAR